MADEEFEYKRVISLEEFGAEIQRRREAYKEKYGEYPELPRNSGENRTESKEPKAAGGQRIAQGHRGYWGEVVMNIRMMAVAGLTLSVLPILAACGEGSAFDESFKTSYREKFVSTCTVGAQGSIPAGVNVDLDKICGCAADKIMEGKSAKELMTTAPGSAEDLAKVQECVKELYPDGVNVKLGS